MTGVLAVIQLNYLSNLLILDDETSSNEFISYGLYEYFIISLLKFNVGEQILEETVEQTGVLDHEFRQVHVLDGLHQNQDLLHFLLFFLLFQGFFVLFVNLNLWVGWNCSSDGTCTCQY